MTIKSININDEYFDDMMKDALEAFLMDCLINDTAIALSNEMSDSMKVVVLEMMLQSGKKFSDSTVLCWWNIAEDNHDEMVFIPVKVKQLLAA